MDKLILHCRLEMQSNYFKGRKRFSFFLSLEILKASVYIIGLQLRSPKWKGSVISRNCRGLNVITLPVIILEICYTYPWLFNQPQFISQVITNSMKVHNKLSQFPPLQVKGRLPQTAVFITSEAASGGVL